MTKLKKQETAITLERPDFLKNDDPNAGNENLTHEDITIPRIGIIQNQSPQRIKSNSKYIEGAEEGMIFNSVSNKTYGNEVLLVPANFEVSYLIFKKRIQGGGFYGAYSTHNEASARLQEIVKETESSINQFEIQQVNNHYGVIVADGQAENVCLSLSSTGLKVSRQLNTLVKMAGGSRFSRCYKLETVLESNSKGDFYIYKVSPAGYPTEEIYNQAKEVYELTKNSFNGEHEVKNTDIETDTGEVPF